MPSTSNDDLQKSCCKKEADDAGSDPDAAIAAGIDTNSQTFLNDPSKAGEDKADAADAAAAAARRA